MNLRPLEPGDFPAAVALYNATSAREVEGGPMDERAFMVDYWEAPAPWVDAGLALEWESTLAGVLLARRSQGNPALRVVRIIALDEDAATELAKAALDVARRHGLERAEGSGGSAVERAAFEAAGFDVSVEVVELRRGLAELPPVPAGLVVDRLRAGEEAEAARVVNVAFGEDEGAVTGPEHLATLRAEGAAVVGRDASGRIVAFASVKASGGEPHVGEIHLVSTAPEARGKGWGRAIMAGALAAVRDLGLKQAWLATGSDNQAAMTLYRAMGFEESKRVPWFERKI